MKKIDLTFLEIRYLWDFSLDNYTMYESTDEFLEYFFHLN